MNKSIRSYHVLVLTILAISIHCYGKENDLKLTNNKRYLWAEGSLGSMNNYPAVGAKLTIEQGLSYSIGVLGYTECIMMCNNSHYVSANTFSMLVGKRLTENLMSIYGSIGISLVSGEKPNGSKDDGINVDNIQKNFSTVGIPIEFGVMISKILGVGLTFHANINKELLMAGIYGSLIIGNIY